MVNQEHVSAALRRGIHVDNVIDMNLFLWTTG